MADNDNFVQRGPRATNGIGNTTQDLQTGLNYDRDGNAVVPEVNVPDGTTVVQQDQIGAFRRTVFSNGAVETVQTKPAERSDGSIGTPVPLPGEQQDVTGTGMDAVTKPKVAGNAVKGKAAEKLGDQ